jgi:hypothetical protein
VDRAHLKSDLLKAKSLRRPIAAAVLILISGAFMVWAGYAFGGGRIAAGLWISTPPGFTIEAAFLLIRRHDRRRGRSAPSRRTRIVQEGVILLAGGVMVLAGYAGADWNWIVASPFILLGLPIIVFAVNLGSRTAAVQVADQRRRRRPAFRVGIAHRSDGPDRRSHTITFR